MAEEVGGRWAVVNLAYGAETCEFVEWCDSLEQAQRRARELGGFSQAAWLKPSAVADVERGLRPYLAAVELY